MRTVKQYIAQAQKRGRAPVQTFVLTGRSTEYRPLFELLSSSCANLQVLRLTGSHWEILLEVSIPKPINEKLWVGLKIIQLSTQVTTNTVCGLLSKCQRLKELQCRDVIWSDFVVNGYSDETEYWYLQANDSIESILLQGSPKGEGNEPARRPVPGSLPAEHVSLLKFNYPDR